jgi:hypothetical protein
MPFFLDEEKKLKTLCVLSEPEHDPVSSSQRLKKLDRVFFRSPHAFEKNCALL